MMLVFGFFLRRAQRPGRKRDLPRRRWFPLVDRIFKAGFWILGGAFAVAAYILEKEPILAFVLVTWAVVLVGPALFAPLLAEDNPDHRAAAYTLNLSVFPCIGLGFVGQAVADRLGVETSWPLLLGFGAAFVAWFFAFIVVAGGFWTVPRRR
jgi:hypothetical protein